MYPSNPPDEGIQATLLIDPSSDPPEGPPNDERVANKSNLDRTEILRAFDDGNSRPIRDLLHDLQERAYLFAQTPVSKKPTELADAFLTLTPTVLGLGLACGWPLHNQKTLSYSPGY
jgi:hypothetical protein